MATDMRTDLLSGDAAKQTGALMSTFALLSAGRDASPLVSAALQLLGNPSTAAEPKRLAYDLALAAQLSDAGAWVEGAGWSARCLPALLVASMPCLLRVAMRRSLPAPTHAAYLPYQLLRVQPVRAADLARLSVAVQADLAKGVPAEVRAKALQALPLLPGHRLEALLSGGGMLERLVSPGPRECNKAMLRGAAACVRAVQACTMLKIDCRPACRSSGISAQASHRHVLRSHPALQVASLRSSSDEVRAAAVEAAGELSARERTLQLAADAPGTLGALIDLWEGLTDALLGEAHCRARKTCRCETTPGVAQDLGQGLHSRSGRRAMLLGCFPCSCQCDLLPARKAPRAPPLYPHATRCTAMVPHRRRNGRGVRQRMCRARATAGRRRCGHAAPPRRQRPGAHQPD